MRSIVLFAEDYGHEAVIKPLVERLVADNGISARVKVISAQGGAGRAMNEMKLFLNDIIKDKERLPDLVITAIDANCKGHQKKASQIDKILPEELKGFIISAVPDPHIERWLLLDSKAFKTVFGTGCKAPGNKCDKGRYKTILAEEIAKAGIDAPLGGIEYAGDIVGTMNIRTVCTDQAFNAFFKDVRGVIARWKTV